MANRKTISEEYKWNIDSIYPSEDLWEQDLTEAEKLAEAFGRFRGCACETAQTLADALEDGFMIQSDKPFFDEEEDDSDEY